MTDVLVIHPYRENRHKMWKSHFFMPERAIQVATYLDDQSGFDVDFIDFSQTTLEDDHVFSVDTPRELKGTGWNFQRYGWHDDEMEQWLDSHYSEYDYFIIDTLTPYFKKGVQFVTDYLDNYVGSENVAMFGEWVGLRPDDFRKHAAIKGNWERGLEIWLGMMESGEVPEPGVITANYELVGMSDLPAPDYHRFVDMDDYPEPHNADYRAGRGCPEKCDFCHVAGIYDGEIRGKSAGQIIEDLKWLIEDQGFSKIKLRDDNFCVRAPIAYKVFKWLGDNHPEVEILQSEGMEMKTAANVPDVIEQMGRCNYDRVAVGFETITEGQFQKNSLEWWDEAHQNFKDAGFGPGEITCFVIRGHPHLTREAEIDTGIYLSDYDVSLLSGGYRLVPGTQLWDEWEGDQPYEYGFGLPQDDPDDEIQKVGQLYSVVTAWNEWGLSLFHSDDPVADLRELSWVDGVMDYGDKITVTGTVSGWTRTDGIEDGLAIILGSRGYHKHKLVENTKTKMTVKGVKGNNPWMRKLLDRAEEQGMEVQPPKGGLL